MKFSFFQLWIMLSLTVGLAQNDLKEQTAPDPLDLKIGDEAPSFALMYEPGKFEFLKTGLRLKVKSLERM